MHETGVPDQPSARSRLPKCRPAPACWNRRRLWALVLILGSITAVAHATQGEAPDGLAFSSLPTDLGLGGQSQGWDWTRWFLVASGLGAAGLALATCASKRMAPTTAPLFALCAGGFLGDLAFSWDAAAGYGLAVRTGLLSLGIVITTLLLYGARVVGASPTLRTAVAVMAVLTGSAWLAMLWTGCGLVTGTLPLRAMGLIAAAVAAGNLVLDFDFIERGARGGLPSGTEWYGAFGSMVSAVWLFLALLPVLA